jgi:uncharacterized protein
MNITTSPTVSANVATVHEIYVAFGGGDVPAFMDKLADELCWESDWENNYAQHQDGPAHFTPHADKAGVARFFQVMSGYTFHDLQVVDVLGAEDKVVAQVKLDYTMPGGGRYRDEQLHLWTFSQAGKVVALRHFLDTAKLLAAARGEDTTLS